MHYIGIDLGGTSIKGAVVTEGGTILKEASCPTQRESGPEHVAREISGLITALAEGYDPQAIGGVGVGCPGIVEDHSGIVRYSANLHWENFDLRAAVQKYSGYTVRLANDANAAALGEVVAGCAQNVDSAVILTLGTGVGSGVVLNGKILTGCTGGAAELGHMVVEDGGALCACGRKGCFETYASATGLIRMAKEAMYFITTVSIRSPSESAKRYFVVPSSGSTRRRRISSVARVQFSRSFSRSDFEISVMQSNVITPRLSHAYICFARNAGSPRDLIYFSRSVNVNDEMSVISVIKKFGNVVPLLRAERIHPRRGRVFIFTVKALNPCCCFSLSG